MDADPAHGIGIIVLVVRSAQRQDIQMSSRSSPTVDVVQRNVEIDESVFFAGDAAHVADQLPVRLFNYRQ